MQAQVEELTGQAGLQILRAILENEVTRRVEPPHRPIPQQAVCSGESSRVTWSSVDRRSRWNDREYEPLRARKEGEKAGGAIVFAPQLGLDLACVGCFGAEEFSAECREIVEIFQGAFIGFGIGAGRSVYDEQVAVCEAKKAQCYAQTLPTIATLYRHTRGCI